MQFWADYQRPGSMGSPARGEMRAAKKTSNPLLAAGRQLLLALLLLACVSASQVHAAAAERSPSGAGSSPAKALKALTTQEVVEHLVRRNLERARSLEAFEGTRVYKLDYRGFPGSRNAEMTVDVKYRRPGTKQFTILSSSGSKLMIDKVFKKLLQSEGEAFDEENQRRTALNNDNYRFELLPSEMVSGRKLYTLSVEPRVPSKFLYRGKIWVDGQDFAVVRIVGEPAKNPSFWTKDVRIEQVYSKVNEFWLPATNRSATTVRLGGHANLSIDYINYRSIVPETPAKTMNAMTLRP